MSSEARAGHRRGEALVEDVLPLHVRRVRPLNCTQASTQASLTRLVALVQAQEDDAHYHLAGGHEQHTTAAPHCGELKTASRRGAGAQARPHAQDTQPRLSHHLLREGVSVSQVQFPVVKFR
jgi:hypothetical protein